MVKIQNRIALYFSKLEKPKEALDETSIGNKIAHFDFRWILLINIRKH